MNDFSFVFYIVSALMFIIILALLIEDKKYKKIYKRLALLIPTFVGISIFIYLVNDIRISLKINQSIDNINKIIGNLNEDNIIELIVNIKKINAFDSAGMAIFSLLATVWIGLNIYNFIEKKDFDELKENSKKMGEKIVEYENQMEKIIKDSENNLKNYEYELDKIRKEYKIELNKELLSDAINDFMIGQANYTKVNNKFGKCFGFFGEEINIEDELIDKYTFGVLTNVVDLSEIKIKITNMEDLHKEDINKLFDVSFAIQNDYTRLRNYFSNDIDFFEKCIDVDKSITDYEKIKVLLKRTENIEFKQDINNAITSMDTSVQNYKKLYNKS